MEEKKKYKLTVLHDSNGHRVLKEEVLRQIISQSYKNVDFMILDTEGNCDLYRRIRKEEADLLLTFELVGFERTTLTNNVSYNLLPCKQIHIITKDNLPNEKYLEKQLSISMFFYCTDSKYYQYLLKKYPDIPYLKETKGWKNSGDEESVETNAKILSDIITEVMQICHMK